MGIPRSVLCLAGMPTENQVFDYLPLLRRSEIDFPLAMTHTLVTYSPHRSPIG